MDVSFPASFILQWETCAFFLPNGISNFVRGCHLSCSQWKGNFFFIEVDEDELTFDAEDEAVRVFASIQKATKVGQLLPYEIGQLLPDGPYKK